VARSQKTDYTGQEFTETVDELDGLAVTLGGTVEEYTDCLDDFIEGDKSAYHLDSAIKQVTGSLERVYDSIDSLDQMLADKELVVKTELNGEKGDFSLEEILSEYSDGVYDSVDSFNDAVLFLHYTDCKDENRRPRIASEQNIGSQLMAERERVTDIHSRLENHTEKLIVSEDRARKHTKEEGSLKTYDPEPPILRMAGHKDHLERVNRLEERSRKKL
jgi:hypothetical protein